MLVGIIRIGVLATTCIAVLALRSELPLIGMQANAPLLLVLEPYHDHVLVLQNGPAADGVPASSDPPPQRKPEPARIQTIATQAKISPSLQQAVPVLNFSKQNFLSEQRQLVDEPVRRAESDLRRKQTDGGRLFFAMLLLLLLNLLFFPLSHINKKRSMIRILLPNSHNLSSSHAFGHTISSTKNLRPALHAYFCTKA